MCLRRVEPSGEGALDAWRTSRCVLPEPVTETGVATMIIMVLVAAYLLTRRSADFAKAEPKTPLPTTVSAPLPNGHVRTIHTRPAARDIDLHSSGQNPRELRHLIDLVCLDSVGGPERRRIPCGIAAYMTMTPS
jgi:hypothetical protein